MVLTYTSPKRRDKQVGVGVISELGKFWVRWKFQGQNPCAIGNCPSIFHQAHIVGRFLSATLSYKTG